MSKFTKHHYEEIADVLYATNASYAIKSAFVDMFTRDNPKFKPWKFWERCNGLKAEDGGR